MSDPKSVVLSNKAENKEAESSLSSFGLIMEETHTFNTLQNTDQSFLGYDLSEEKKQLIKRFLCYLISKDYDCDGFIELESVLNFFRFSPQDEEVEVLSYIELFVRHNNFYYIECIRYYMDECTLENYSEWRTAINNVKRELVEKNERLFSRFFSSNTAAGHSFLHRVSSIDKEMVNAPFFSMLREAN